LHACAPVHAASVLPEGTLVQVPMLPATLHAWQVPAQALLQQTPSTQLPLAHWLELVHVCPLIERQWPAPSQVCEPEHTGLVSLPFSGMLVQVPTVPGRAHDWQAPVQGASQQTLSTQLPLAHWAGELHAWPAMETHCPLPLQALVPAQRGFVSVPPSGMLTQMPGLPAWLQVWQGPLHAPPQQTPSTQKPLAHCALALHGWPLIERQLPPPLHTWLPLHEGFVSVPPCGMLVQVPTAPARLHAWQVPLHAVLQQTLSTQKPVVHCEAPVQVPPLTETQLPLPLHACEPLQGGFVSVPPCGMLVQVPVVPARLHAWQLPLQPVLQQTPSMQLPLVHSVALAHATPLPLSGMQAPPAQ
jgi:hypothetical protein